MKTFRNYRDQSRTNWGGHFAEGENPTREDVKFGALLRIADGVEKMAQRHTELIEQRDRYERWHQDALKRQRLLEHRLRAAKGQITRLRKKIENSTPLGNWGDPQKTPAP